MDQGHTRRFVLAVVAASVATLGAAGCGSSSSSSTAKAITKAEFVTRANAICAKGNAQQAAFSTALGRRPTQAQVTTMVQTKLIPNIQSQINSVRALGAPAGDEAKITTMLNSAQADLNRLKANPALINSNTLFNNFIAIAHPYGLTKCAQSS